MAEDKDGFLSRWSRRKQAHEANPESDPDAPETLDATDAKVLLAEELEAEEAQLLIETEEAEANRLVAEAVDLDEIESGFDFSIFLKRGVPGQLRKKALQKFFNSNPVLANLDGLNDYDEDYNNPLHMVYKSSWDVTRGFLTEAEKLLQQATGRLTEDEPLDEMPEELAEDDAELTDDTAELDDDAPELTAEEPAEDSDMPDDDQPGSTDETEMVSNEPDVDDTPDQELPQQKRVSIRQRMNG
ncbi:Protein of unknown function (DUF3306) [Hoeflea sp. IMCC20628]|uniref:DUF3306 domain-containing protein n=1 Tax=Hoeflea sp. IMCC20628 TaxID=1620421 RepID=UPI00063BF1FC|nr:DUF3306 domain-containing protein [Hoeflea sp. IMCC20628]AKI01991.1 Protein of unknown function (DUF3306) [Hoeflea sp. IMCC20628]